MAPGALASFTTRALVKNWEELLAMHKFTSVMLEVTRSIYPETTWQITFRFSDDCRCGMAN